jgi:NADH:flavin oxidoreductase / NADH oxidase family
VVWIGIHLPWDTSGLLPARQPGDEQQWFPCCPSVGVKVRRPRRRRRRCLYPHLFSPLQIGNVTVRNRIMQTAHVKLFAHNAVDSQRNVDYQAARAKGAGLLITGNRVVRNHADSRTGAQVTMGGTGLE